MFERDNIYKQIAITTVCYSHKIFNNNAEKFPYRIIMEDKLT